MITQFRAENQEVKLRQCACVHQIYAFGVPRDYYVLKE